MLTLPNAIVPVLHPFATLFRNPTWLKAQSPDLVVHGDTGSRPTHRWHSWRSRAWTLHDRSYARYLIAECCNRAVAPPGG